MPAKPQTHLSNIQRANEISRVLREAHKREGAPTQSAVAFALRNGPGEFDISEMTYSRMVSGSITNGQLSLPSMWQQIERELGIRDHRLMKLLPSWIEIVDPDAARIAEAYLNLPESARRSADIYLQFLLEGKKKGEE